MADKLLEKPARVAKKTAMKAAKPRKMMPKPQSGEVVLLSGGNPQIAK